ncbi:hypothetical protein SKC37_09270 [Aquirufa sp. HETE-83D]|uniref:Uncharacterized protein n=1 Tax=Aquirufa esocilacus TaxID=3096513 RepID=A0ABW6DMT8_9BACT
MKKASILFLFFLLPLFSSAQKVENKKYSCSPKTTTNSVFKEIGNVKFEDFSNRGTSWSFFGTQKITTKDGIIFLKGDIYSPRGSQLNTKVNNYNKPVFILYNEWDCIIDK